MAGVFFAFGGRAVLGLCRWRVVMMVGSGWVGDGFIWFDLAFSF